MQSDKFPLPVHMLRCTPQLSNPRPQSYNFTNILFNCISSTDMASFPPPSSVSVFINLAHQLILLARGYNLSISCACALRRAKQLPGRKLCQCLFERIVPSLPCHKTRNLSWSLGPKRLTKLGLHTSPPHHHNIGSVAKIQPYFFLVIPN